MKTLDDFVEALPTDLSENVPIDVSEYLKEPPGTTVFVYHDLTTNQLFQAGVDAKKLTRMAEFIEMPETLGGTVATMALAHVSPAFQNPPGITYARMANKNAKLFMWLMNRFLDQFPHLKDLEAAISASKKTSSVE